MKVLFLGGDQRQLAIINDLHKRHTIDVVGYDKIQIDHDIKNIDLKDIDIAQYDVIIFPVSGVQENYLLKASFSDRELYLKPSFLVDARRDSLIFTGVRTKWLDEMLKLSNKWVIPLMEDHEIKSENSVPTVEGIIADLIYSTPHTLSGSNVLVLGYGNVGKLLVEKLQALDAKVSVGVLLQNDLEVLGLKNIKAFYTNDKNTFDDYVKQNDIIINTVPTMLLDKHYLDLVNKDTYILDISSYPYGVDFDYAKSIGLKNKLFLGIPSIVAPKTAGLILSKKINKIIGGER